MIHIPIWIFPINVVEWKAAQIPIDRLLHAFAQRQQVINFLIGGYKPARDFNPQRFDCAETISLAEGVLAPFAADAVILPQPTNQDFFQQDIS